MVTKSSKAQTYMPGKAPLHLATRNQLSEKKLVPLDDPAGYVKLKNGTLLPLYDWRETKHSRTASPTAQKRTQ